MGRAADRACFENRITLFLKISLRQSARHAYGNEVHHDGVDDLMGAESSFQDSRDGCPRSATEDRHHACNRNQDPCWTVRQGNSGPSRCECGNCELTFGSDVQQPTTKTDCDCEAGEYKRRSIEESVANPVRPGERAADEQSIGLDGIVADGGNHDGSNQERCEYGNYRE